MQSKLSFKGVTLAMPRGNNRHRRENDGSPDFSAELMRPLPQGKKFGIGRLVTFDNLQEVVNVLPHPDRFRKYSFGAAAMYVTSKAVGSRLTNGGVGRGGGREGILEAYRSQLAPNQQSAGLPVKVPVRGYKFSADKGTIKAKLIVNDIPDDQYDVGYQIMGEREVAYRLAGITDPLAPLQRQTTRKGKVPYYEVRIGRYPADAGIRVALGGLVVTDAMPSEVELLPVSVLK